MSSTAPPPKFFELWLDPSAPDQVGDPYPLRSLMRHERVRRREHDARFLTQHDEAVAALKQRALGAESVPAALDVLASAWGVAVPGRVSRAAARLLAPQQHAGYAHFCDWIDSVCSSRTMAQLGSVAHVVVRDRLKLIKARGRSNVDLIQEIAVPLWPDVLAIWAGLVEQQRRRLHHLVRAVQLLLNPGKLLPRSLPGMVRALDELLRMFSAAYRQADPLQGSPSLFPALEAAWTPTVGAVEDEIVMACIHLLLAGRENAPARIGNLFDFLVDHPDLMAELRAQPESAAAVAGKASLDAGCAAHGTLALSLAQLQAEVVLGVLLSSFECIERSAGIGERQTRSAGAANLEHLRLRVDRR